jgi:hypothetical protein
MEGINQYREQSLIFMLSEMFSEEVEGSSNLTTSATVLSLRELFRRIKTPSRKLMHPLY